jgi:hypothetical protein
MMIDAVLQVSMMYSIIADIPVVLTGGDVVNLSFDAI